MEKAIKDRVAKWRKEASVDSKEATEAEAFEQLTELLLDAHKFTTFKPEDCEMLKKFKNLTKLTLNQTGLQSLENLPSIESLSVLELTDNHLNNVEMLKYIVKNYPNLRKLQIGGNHFKNIKDFEELKGLSKLEKLGVEFNPCAEDNNYRKHLFEILPNVKVIDGFNKEGNEVFSDDEDEEEEEEEEEEKDTTLKNFYEADYKEEDEEEDEEFVPEEVEEEEEDDEIDEDLEEEEIDLDKEDDDIETELKTEVKEDKGVKRKQDSLDNVNEVDPKKNKVE